MISHTELKRIARVRLRDARLLFRQRCYDSAMYLCGYSVEIGLKAVICKSLKLKGIPSTGSEFSTIKQLKSHNFEQLLGLTDNTVRQDIKANLFSDWSIVQNWDPEIRYTPISTSKNRRKEANDLLKATGKVYNSLRKYID